MYYGKKKRCTLIVDLTRYHEHLTPGAKGFLIPELTMSNWGNEDRFGAVKFDCCGATLDILFKSLSVEEDR